jgi:hypothetical protein
MTRWGVPVGRSGYEGVPARDADEFPPGSDGDGRRRRGLALAALGIVLAAGLVGLLVWQSTRTASRVTRVRYVNDTGAPLVVTPCGATSRCVIEAGAAVVRTPPAKGEAWRVLDARTQRSAGCIRDTGEPTVRLSSTRYGGFC